SAPSSRAAARSKLSPTRVRRMTGSQSCSARMRRSTSRPSMSGIITSRITRSGRRRATAVSAAVPSPASSTSRPLRSRTGPRCSRMVASSSTRSTRGRGAPVGSAVIADLDATVLGARVGVVLPLIGHGLAVPVPGDGEIEVGARFADRGGDGLGTLLGEDLVAAPVGDRVRVPVDAHLGAAGHVLDQIDDPRRGGLGDLGGAGREEDVGAEGDLGGAAVGAGPLERLDRPLEREDPLVELDDAALQREHVILGEGGGEGAAEQDGGGEGETSGAPHRISTPVAGVAPSTSITSMAVTSSGGAANMA